VLLKIKCILKREIVGIGGQKTEESGREVHKNIASCCLLRAGFLLGLLFDPEDDCDIFL
jgi:hypothetical protein